MKRKKLLGIIAVVLVVASMLAVCGANQSATAAAAATNSEKKVVVGCSVYYMTEFVTLMVEGIRDAAKDRGADLILLDANNDAQKQLSQVENLIAQKVDVIVVAAVDTDAIVPAIGMAKAAGIPLTAVNMLMNTKEDYYYVGPNDVEAGELEAEYLFKLLDGKGNIVILEGPIGTSAQLQRMEGNRNMLAKYPDIKLLANQPANWNREQALTLTENWLQAFPGQIDGIIGHNDEMALGAIMALEAKGLKDKIPVVGVDAIKDACEAIMAGRMEATVFQDAYYEGYHGVIYALDVLAGNLPSVMKYYIKMDLITKENSEKTAEELYNKIYKK